MCHFLGEVVVIMVLASTRPILLLAESIMLRLAALVGGTLAAFWITVMTVGPLLGSFITEPAAMTITALLLSKKFYDLEPSNKFKYATLGLLFVNVSVGGTLTHFAAPPVLMVAGPWGWGTEFMLTQFGWKAVIGILCSNGLYFWVFRKELARMQEGFALRSLKEEIGRRFVTRELIEREWAAAEVETKKELDLFDSVDGATREFVAKVRQRLEAKLLPREQRPKFQDPDWDGREDPVPVWVTAIHLTFMGWTIINSRHAAFFILGLLFFLGFAQVTPQYQNRIYLQSPMLVGFFLAGAVTGGGLTIIANAPNPAGQSILKRYFGAAVSPMGLLKAALVPTAILWFCLALL